MLCLILSSVKKGIDHIVAFGNLVWLIVPFVLQMLDENNKNIYLV
jgi:hypothetical protein